MNITKEVSVCITPEDIVEKSVKTTGWELLILLELCLKKEKEVYGSLHKCHLDYHREQVKAKNAELIEYQLQCLKGSREVVNALEQMLKTTKDLHEGLKKYHIARGYHGPWYWEEQKKETK